MKIHKLSHQSIKPYGKLIDRTSAKEQKDGNGWGFVIRVRSKGWRIAYLVLRNRSFKRLECHDSPETFEPVKGRAVIALFTPAAVPGTKLTKKWCQAPKLKMKFFHLNKPIILNKGVWHALYTRTKESHIKIVENSSLRTIKLPGPQN